MSRVFPKNSRAFAGRVLLACALLAAYIVWAGWYYLTPKYSRVGYAPTQPIAFSHALHVGQIGLDCTYCHSHVTESDHSNIPTAQTCWNCHGDNKGNIKSASGQLEPLRQAIKSGLPIVWERIHKVPDYAYFTHAVHVSRGVSCVSCHGQVNEMAIVREEQPLSMSWCLDCHRDPAPSVRPAEEVTNLTWIEKRDQKVLPIGQRIVNKARINPPVMCSGCHR